MPYLSEWRCPAPEMDHPEMLGGPTAWNKAGEITEWSTTRTPSTIILVDDASSPYHCFFCNAELVKVRGVPLLRDKLKG